MANWENSVNRSSSSLEIADVFSSLDWTLCFVGLRRWNGTHPGELVGQEMQWPPC